MSGATTPLSLHGVVLS